jgi:hypothetical protein
MASVRRIWKFARSLLLGLALGVLSYLAVIYVSGVPSFLAEDKLSVAHSRKDYERPRPLVDALESEDLSVEADVFHGHDGFRVSQRGLLVRGTLEELYLRPLQRRADRQGKIQGDLFYLWIGLKSPGTEQLDSLVELLGRYPVVKSGKLQLVFTGDEALLTVLRERIPSAQTATAWSEEPGAIGDWYVLSWPERFDWNGEGPMPEADERELQRLVAAAREQGRKLRIDDAPEAAWLLLEKAGADLVGISHSP